MRDKFKRGEWRASLGRFKGGPYVHVFGPKIGDGFIDAIFLKDIRDLKRLLDEVEEEIKKRME
jgi:hypothetical protein